MENKKFNLEDKEFQFWKPITIDNLTYTFDHIEASKQIYKHPARNESYTVYITISHHVFTVHLNKAEEHHTTIYPHKPSDKRYFCNIRYKLSLQLPKILETLPEQYCYHGGYGKYCLCKIDDEYGNSIYYQIVIKVWKARKKLRFHIESAYPLYTKPKTKRVNFWVICYNLLYNRKLPKPPR